MLGTDFKAGQTKFKTAAVEYIRSLGMCPKVQQSFCDCLIFYLQYCNCCQ